MEMSPFPTVDTEVLVIGAGAAGLATAACLRREQIPHLILERSDQPGSTWGSRYDRLNLHTHRRFSALPFLPFPDRYPKYPSRKQLADYLALYARTFGLAPRYGQSVTEARPEGGGWFVSTLDTRYRAPFLVVATGQSHTPHRPTWPGLDTFPGAVLHSTEFSNGSVFTGSRVLVVGFGNSAGEIALDLCEHGARAAMSVRGPINAAPRDMMGLSTHVVAVLLSRFTARTADALTRTLPKLVLGDLEPYGLRRLPYGGMTQIERDKTTPLIDVGTIDLIKRGAIVVYPGIARFEADNAVFDDGRRAPFDAVVLATGYRQNLSSFLKHADAALDSDGNARTSGEESGVPGLFFCGFRNARGGLLREIGREARRIAHLIRAQSADRN
jgi:cation diffusion facilitator CzcD-associated flavoprotein CzcO